MLTRAIASPTPTIDTPTARAARLDSESRGWIERLSPQSPQRDTAIAALHAHLLKAARYEVGRRRPNFPHLRGGDYDDLAQQSADDALLAVLSKLEDFRGESRFTTWAYKFALFEAGAKILAARGRAARWRWSPRAGPSSPTEAHPPRRMSRPQSSSPLYRTP